MLLGRARAEKLGCGRGPSRPASALTVTRSGTLTEILTSSLNLTGGEQITSPYEESKWVHACIRALSTAASQATLRFYVGDPDDAEDGKDVQELPKKHELRQLFELPSEHQTGMQFREANLVHRKLDGETIWFMMDAEGKPVAQGQRAKTIDLPDTIVPVRGSAVEIRCDKRGLPETYIYPSRSREEFPAHSVVHFRDYDPNSPLRGLGDVEVLMRDLAVEYQAQRYQEGLLANGGDPGGWLIAKGSISDEKRRGTEAAVNDRYSNVENAGKWHMIVGKEVEIKPNDMKPKDMEYMSLRGYTFSSVCALLGVPTILLGDTSAATYSNYEQAMRQLWIGPNGVVSYLRSEEDVINAFFLRRLSVAGAERIYARYDYSAVPEMQEDSTEVIDKAAEIAARGIGMSFNDALNTLGVTVEEAEAGNLQLIHSTLRPVDELNRTEEEAAPAKPKEEAAPRRATLADIEEFFTEAELAEQEYVRKALDVVLPHERKLDIAMNKYLRKYELAQIKRIEQFAKTGKAIGSSVPAHELPVVPPFATAKGFDVADLTAKDIERLLLDPEEWAEKLFDASSPIINATFEAASLSVQSEIGLTGLTMEDAAVINYLEEQGLLLANGVGGVDGTLSTKVQKALLDVFEGNAGVTVNNLQEAVRELLPELRGSLKKAFTDRDSRALTIAQTETGKASSTARYMNYQKSDVVERHQWLTSGDGAVRESHQQLNGKVRDIGDEFKPGLKYPLDPDATDAAEVINCRCVTAPIIKS